MLAVLLAAATCDEVELGFEGFRGAYHYFEPDGKTHCEWKAVEKATSLTRACAEQCERRGCACA